MTAAEILASITDDSVKWDGADLDAAISAIPTSTPSISDLKEVIQGANCLGYFTHALMVTASANIDGTSTTPGNEFNGALGDSTAFNLNEYDIMYLFGTYFLNQYNHYGNATNNGDGVISLEYWDGTAWVVWDTFTPTAVAAWAGIQTPGDIWTNAIRVLCTTEDTSGSTKITQIELETI